jgi:Hypothetical glycosyl hydrolase family 15
MLALAATCSQIASATALAPDTREFPRLAGMNIGSKHYDQPDYQKQLAGYDWLILGFYPGWRGMTVPNATPGSVIEAIKRHKPDILIGQYTNLMEAYYDPNNLANRDIYEKLTAQGWWLSSKDGTRIQWTQEYKTWLVDISSRAEPDDNGDRFPEWLARRNWGKLFSNGAWFDIWFTDNVEKGPKSLDANWHVNPRTPGYSNQVSSEYRDAFRTYWNEARKFAPDKLLAGNIAGHGLDFNEYRQQLNLAFIEALYGAQWSAYTKQGWTGMMQQYFAARDHLQEPKLVGFNVWASLDDLALMRFMFASWLLGDGYFVFSDKKNLYSSVPWFDEFDIKLGHPLDAATLKEWQPSLHRRRFERGVVFVNPGSKAVAVKLDKQYRRPLGKQDPSVNDGNLIDVLRLPPRSGAILLNAE